MNFYIVLSLAIVFSLLIWWSYLAISGIRNASLVQQRVSSRRFSRLANYLISMVHLAIGLFSSKAFASSISKVLCHAIHTLHKHHCSISNRPGDPCYSPQDGVGSSLRATKQLSMIDIMSPEQEGKFFHQLHSLSPSALSPCIPVVPKCPNSGFMHLQGYNVKEPNNQGLKT
jgi:hypothetical protein